jgi:hypothetical protein
VPVTGIKILFLALAVFFRVKYIRKFYELILIIRYGIETACFEFIKDYRSLLGG